MTPPRNVLVAIATAVERQGGDMADVEDLLSVWQRVARRNDERADVIRREARELHERYRRTA
jgi:hypothetical protein